MNTTRARTLVPLLLLSTALGLAACGSNDSSGGPDGGKPSVTTAVPSPASPAEAALAFAECMRDNGVESFPDPEVSGGQVLVRGPGTDDPDLAEAQKTCEPLMDSGSGFSQPDEAQMAQMQERMLAFAECMREHGIDMPDPEMDDSGTFQAGVGGPGAASPDDPKFAAAQQECGGLPGFGGPGSGR